MEIKVPRSPFSLVGEPGELIELHVSGYDMPLCAFGAHQLPALVEALQAFTVAPTSTGDASPFAIEQPGANLVPFVVEARAAAALRANAPRMEHVTRGPERRRVPHETRRCFRCGSATCVTCRGCIGAATGAVMPASVPRIACESAACECVHG